MGLIDGLFDVFEDVVGFLFDGLNTLFGNFLGLVCYQIVSILCYLLKIVYDFFSVFAGMKTVTYNGSQQYLINIFFGNTLINDVYWSMALVGVVIVFVMLIIAVIRKASDISGKQQQSYGLMLVGAGKNILTILLMSAIMSASISITNVLIQQVGYIFDHAGTYSYTRTHKFTNEEFAAMARIYNTVGNYALNDSYNSRYNLNSCYNEIREDLLYLDECGVFDFYYDDSDGATWQSELQKLMLASNPRYDVKIDAYTSTSAQVLSLMETVKKNNSFKPIAQISVHFGTNTGGGSDDEVSLDRIIFLMGTLNAANSSKYNENPSLTDALRGPFYYGQKSIYDRSDVREAFDISFDGISYLLIGIMTWLTLKNLTLCIFNCIARIFNLLGLYIISPPLVATSPLDNGEKFKQWITSTVVQMFGIFGTIIPMRLVIMFIPIVLDNKLVFFDRVTIDILAKAVLIVGAVEAANKFSGILTGILANSAGYASVMAGDMRGVAGKTFSTVAGGVGKALGGTAKLAAGATGMSTLANKVGSKLSAAGSYMKNHYGLFGIGGAVKAGWNAKSAGLKKEQQEMLNDAKLEKDMKEFKKQKKSEGANKSNPPANHSGGSGGNGGNKPLPEMIKPLKK